MPLLLDLPNEIMIFIIDLVHVADIESFSSCNKRIRWLSKEVLIGHGLMKTQYGDLDFGRFNGHSVTRPSRGDLRTPHAIFFLRDMIKN